MTEPMSVDGTDTIVKVQARYTTKGKALVYDKARAHQRIMDLPESIVAAMGNVDVDVAFFHATWVIDAWALRKMARVQQW